MILVGPALKSTLIWLVVERWILMSQVCWRSGILSLCCSICGELKLLPEQNVDSGTGLCQWSRVPACYQVTWPGGCTSTHGFPIIDLTELTVSCMASCLVWNLHLRDLSRIHPGSTAVHYINSYLSREITPSCMHECVNVVYCCMCTT